MNYIIGINGGGTGSSCIICDERARILFRCSGGPTNFLRYDINDVCKTVYSLINTCRKNQNITFRDIKTIVIGTAGAGRETDAKFLLRHLRRYLIKKNAAIKTIRIVSDAIIALESAFPNKPGSILISGTGSIMFGKNKAGKYFRVGGFGNKIGDEGSGYSIGRKGLQAVAKQFDGRGENSLLSYYINRKFKIIDGSELILRIYKNNFDIASFAPLVIKAADKKDKIAIKILNDEANELTYHIKTMKKLMNIRNLKVALSGSLISGKNYYSDSLKRKIKSSLNGVEIIKAKNPPEMGAILLALKYLNA